MSLKCYAPNLNPQRSPVTLKINIAITLTGAWNGDLYAYVSHASGFCILINRLGRSLAVPDGSGSAGLDVLFTDTATLDLHTTIPSSGLVTGIPEPTSGLLVLGSMLLLLKRRR